jgi:archaellin
MFDVDDTGEGEEEAGQVGIGTLIVFISLVLVAAIAAGVLINTAGLLQQTSEATGEQSRQQVTNRIVVSSVIGSVDSGTNPNSIDQVDLTAKLGPGASDVRVSDATIEFVTPRRTFKLVAEGTETTSETDGQFEVLQLTDDDNSLSQSNTLNDIEDRAVIRIDYDNNAQLSNADQLVEGETAVFRITTQSGGISETVAVPDSLAQKSTVEL